MGIGLRKSTESRAMSDVIIIIVKSFFSFVPKFYTVVLLDLAEKSQFVQFTVSKPLLLLLFLLFLLRQPLISIFKLINKLLINP